MFPAIIDMLPHVLASKQKYLSKNIKLIDSSQLSESIIPKHVGHQQVAIYLKVPYLTWVSIRRKPESLFIAEPKAGVFTPQHPI